VAQNRYNKYLVAALMLAEMYLIREILSRSRESGAVAAISLKDLGFS
jgi:hypothetical protein